MTNVQEVSTYDRSCKIVANEHLRQSVLEDELSAGNYKDWFRTLLYMEENRRTEILQNRSVCKVIYTVM